MDRDDLLALVRKCEAKLADGRRALDELADALATLSAAVQGFDVEPGPGTPLQEVLASHRDELVSLVAAALEKGSNARANREGYMQSLIRRTDDDSYRLGRRRLSFTDTEKHVLDLFWDAMPEPVSRDALLDSLYPNDSRPAAGAIDVFVSKLRQKLKLASGGTEFIESIRGKGWALKPELCRASRSEKAEAPERRQA